MGEVMYNHGQVEWWWGRSQSPEYQKAYDNIARFLGFKWKVLLDVACGPGELIKRAYKFQPNRVYVGSDATPEMLEIARGNLSGEGIPVRIVSSLERLTLNPNEVILFQDDIGNSRIPYDLADLTTFTFKEIITFIEEEDLEKSQKYLKQKLDGINHTPINQEDVVNQLVIEREIVKRCKLGGMVLKVDYRSRRIGDVNQQQAFYDRRKLFRVIGLELESTNFFDHSEVWQDTKGILKPGKIPGYRVFKARRVR